MCKYIVNKFEQVKVVKGQGSKYPCGRGSDVTYQKLGQIRLDHMFSIDYQI